MRDDNDAPGIKCQMLQNLSHRYHRIFRTVLEVRETVKSGDNELPQSMIPYFSAILKVIAHEDRKENAMI